MYAHAVGRRTLRIKECTAHVYTHFTRAYAPYMYAHATHQRTLYTNACAFVHTLHKCMRICAVQVARGLQCQLRVRTTREDQRDCSRADSERCAFFLALSFFWMIRVPYCFPLSQVQSRSSMIMNLCAFSGWRRAIYVLIPMLIRVVLIRR